LNGIFKTAGEFPRDQNGASIIEYGLVLALVAIVCVAGTTLLGGQINSFLGSFSSTI